MAYIQKNYTYNPVLSAEENVLLDILFKLKLSHMAEALEKQFLNPNCDLESFADRITDIINYEWEQRQTTKFNKLLRKATLKYPEADFDDSIYEPDRQLDTHTIELLQKCEWVRDARNLLITGSAGAGKTYIANALCIAALHQQHTVRYIRANTLIQESEKARMASSSYDYVNQMASYQKGIRGSNTQQIWPLAIYHFLRGRHSRHSSGYRCLWPRYHLALYNSPQYISLILKP